MTSIEGVGTFGERVKASLIEDGVTTPVSIGYLGNSVMELDGLQEELPRLLKLDWAKRSATLSMDGKELENTAREQFDFYKLLDPRLIRKSRVIRVASVEGFERKEARVVLLEHDTSDLDLPSDLVTFLGENKRTVRRVSFLVYDGGIRYMSQFDLPPRIAS